MVWYLASIPRAATERFVRGGRRDHELFYSKGQPDTSMYLGLQQIDGNQCLWW